MKNLIYFFLLFILVGCQNPDYGNNNNNNQRTRNTNTNNNNLKNITGVSDLRVRADDFKKTVNSKDCKNYNSGVPTFKLSESAFQKAGTTHPITDIENCVSKGIDDSAKDICEKEQQLLAARREYSKRNDAEADEAIAQIDEALDVIDITKQEMEYALYQLLDSHLDLTDHLYDELDKRDDIVGALGRYAVTTELGSTTAILTAKASNICRYTR